MNIWKTVKCISLGESGSCIQIRDKKELHKPFHDKSSMAAFFESLPLCQKEKQSDSLSLSLTCKEKCTAMWRQQHRRRQSLYKQHAFSNTHKLAQDQPVEDTHLHSFHFANSIFLNHCCKEDWLLVNHGLWYWSYHTLTPTWCAHTCINKSKRLRSL